MIDAIQLRAARAMLDWKTSDLAEMSGVALNAINKIERSKVLGRRDTMEKLQKVFEGAGLEFLPDSGVRMKNRIVITYAGEDCFKNLMVDVYETLQSTGGEFLVAHLEEGLAKQSLNEDFMREQIHKRKETNISCRMLVRADDPNLVPPYDTYRAIPDEFFSPYPFCMYGSKLALVSWKPSPQVIIIDDERFAESARKLFEIAWISGGKILRKDK